MSFYEWFEDHFGYPVGEAQSPAWVSQLREVWVAGYREGWVDSGLEEYEP